MIIFKQKNCNRIAIPVLIVMGCMATLINHPAPVKADATPEINFAPSNMQNGQSVTIIGSGFGVKSPVEPLRYDDFQDGTVGDGSATTPQLKNQANGGFNTRGQLHYPYYSIEQQRFNGDIVATQHYMGVDTNQTIALERTPEWQIEFPKLYASFWIHRQDISGNNKKSSNMKLWGNVGTQRDGGYEGFPQARADAFGHLATPLWDIYGANSPDGTVDTPVTAYCALGIPMNPWFDHEFTDWVRVERYIDSGTVDGNDFRQLLRENLQTIADVGPGCGSLLYPNGRVFDYFFLGQYWRDDSPDYPNQESKTYTSELYVDNTQSRIEIGDASSWDDCTHREIQIPHTTWNDGQIQFTVNQGTFTDDDPAYLYVVDENGAVNTTGYPITFAGAVECTPNWQCLEWSACADSAQTRSCHDDNICGSDTDRPVEMAECDSTAPARVTDLTVTNL